MLTGADDNESILRWVFAGLILLLVAAACAAEPEARQQRTIVVDLTAAVTDLGTDDADVEEDIELDGG